MTFSAPLKLPPVLAGIISKKASEEDLGTIVFILKVLTEYFKDEIPEQAYKELMERYSETRTQKREKYLERRKKALMRLGFPEEEAEDLAKLPKEEFKLFIEASKAKAYNKQTERTEEKQREDEEERLLDESRRKEKLIEETKEKLSLAKSRFKNASKGAYMFKGKSKEDVLNDLQIEITTLEKKISELEGNEAPT